MIAATETPSLEERTERLIQRRHSIDLLELEWAQEAACLAATDHYMEEGFTTPLEWIRIVCKMTSTQAAERVAVGEQMPTMPESVQALAGRRDRLRPPGGDRQDRPGPQAFDHGNPIR